MEPHIPWPPPYTLKKHKRAKRVKLIFSRERGLEITIPTRFSLKHIPSVLDEHKPWVLKQFQRINLFDVVALPNTIFLPAIQENWQVIYVEAENNLKLIARPQNELVVYGPVQHKKQCQALLIRWLKKKAKSQLIPLLDDVSSLIKKPYKSISIRDQQTRWGSCSSEKSISLNYKLLFLPELLCRHVMIHELCHTIYLDHSHKFWSLVAEHDPNWKTHKYELKKADVLIPDWLYRI